MAVIYASLIIKGKKTFIEVPDKIKDKVRDELVAQGYTLNDDGTVSKDDELLLGK